MSISRAFDSAYYAEENLSYYFINYYYNLNRLIMKKAIIVAGLTLVSAEVGIDNKGEVDYLEKPAKEVEKPLERRSSEITHIDTIAPSDAAFTYSMSVDYQSFRDPSSDDLWLSLKMNYAQSPGRLLKRN